MEHLIQMSYITEEKSEMNTCVQRALTAWFWLINKTNLQQIKHYCTVCCLILIAQLYQIHSKFSKYQLQNNHKIFAIIYVLSNQHLHFYVVTFKGKEAVKRYQTSRKLQSIPLR